MSGRRHHLHSPWNRAAYSFALVAVILTVGTLGLHGVEGMPYLEAFYFMSMIATCQGPTVTPATAAGKLFVSIMAFISVGSVVTSLGFLFGPFFGQLWRIGVVKLEEEAHLLAHQRDSKKSS